MADPKGLTEANIFANEVVRRASVSLSNRKIHTKTYSIGRLSFRLTAPEPETGSWLGHAFLQGPDHSSGATAGLHHLVAWDGTSEEVIPPAPPWPREAIEPLGVVSTHSNAAIRFAFDIHTNSLIVYNFERNLSHTWFPDIVQLPPWAKASPFRIKLSWLCNLHRMQIVHGAAVGIRGRAVLLAGKGGSGKSTTALACALAGFDYLGDDYCAVEPAAGTIHMIYRTAKFFVPTLEMIPALAASVVNRDRMDVEKGVIFLQPKNASLVGSAELSAILLPRVGTQSTTTLYPAKHNDTINAILPSTVGGLMGGTSATPRLILELVRSVPAFHLVLGTDLKTVIDVITSQLA